MPLTPDQAAFLRDNAFPAVLTALRPDGSPHSTVVWMHEDNGDVVVNTALGRAKDRFLRNDGRASVVVVDPTNQYKWVGVSGAATLETEGAYEQIDQLSNKYLGKDYPWRSPDETRVTVRIKAEKVDAMGFDA
ncbi:MAG: TIGR03618 family F420-dependent PPOX class oxidoreductase [Actinobacteria bacterium]|uniref:Unannotated protein n=1 Tax=freshwater metagenome TaxID=449393 RepID=A0A6J6P6T6_9ZZZZ|nr:TIGR03618 family F420-dependent PPOX class oxidoreductase [Actinomycetota bacterium]